MKVFLVNGRKILAGIGILMLLAVSAGCSEAEKFSWERMKETHYRLVTGKTLKKTDKAAKAVVGQADRQAAETETKSAEGQSKVKITLYFADQNGDYLKSETREIAMVPGIARATIQELIEGPVSKELTATIPEGTKLRDINIENGTCTVDFSKEFKDNHWGGSSGELLTVYSVVNTLTQFDTVDEVEILVEGRKIDTLAGHMDLSVPVSRNSQIIKGTE